MFGTNDKSKIDHFCEIAAYIVDANPNGLTATQKKNLTAISEKLSAKNPKTLPQLLEALTKKKAPPKRKTAKQKVPMDPAKLDSLINDLTKLVSDRAQFELKVDQLNKAHTAPELKKLTSAFVAGAKPRTKADAVRILKAERNDRQRADAKADEAGRTRPW